MSPTDNPQADLTGKVCMITGATSGIGKAAAIALASCNPTLFLVARSPERAKRSVEEIAEASGNTKIETLIGDFASLQDIRRVAAEFLATGQPLHILFNNAGVVMLNREETVDGFETTFAVNHLGYFLLTNLLLDRIRESAPARIVNTASGAHAYSGGRLDFDDLQSSKSFSSMKVYAKSKLANILFTRTLGQKLDGSGVTVNCFHPGLVGSNLAVNNGLLAKLMVLALRPIARTNEKGAETGVYLCLSPKVEDKTGLYFYDKKPKWPKSYAQNDKDAARLWEESLKLTGLA